MTGGWDVDSYEIENAIKMKVGTIFYDVSIGKILKLCN